MKLTYTAELPHFEYDKMEVTIEPFGNICRIAISVADGKEGRVSMSLNDFERIHHVATAFIRAKGVVGE